MPGSDPRRTRVRRFYDAFADQYDADRYSTVGQLQESDNAVGAVLDLLSDRNLNGARVLDCGCGTGRFSGVFDSAGAEVLGVDSSPNMLEIARSKVPSATFQLGDLFTLGFRREFDVVICSQVLTHLHDYEAPLIELGHAVRADGVVIIDIRNALSPRFFLSRARVMMQKFARRAPDYDPHYTTLKRIRVAAASARLSVVGVLGVGKSTVGVRRRRAGRLLAPTLVIRLEPTEQQ